MANIEHQEQLDVVDKVSVVLYRMAWIVVTLSFGWASYSGAYQHSIWQPLWLLAVGCSLLAHNLHIYNKLIRYLVAACGWLALWLTMSYYLWHWPFMAMFSLGAFYAVIGALAYKESFCFNLGLLRWMPLLLVADWVLSLGDWQALRVVSLLLAAIGCLLIAYHKIKQPLYYDIGKRSHYQL
ncbi:DUF2301 domain-containing membrane protein [Agarivorans sp. MS3-6]